MYYVIQGGLLSSGEAMRHNDFTTDPDLTSNAERKHSCITGHGSMTEAVIAR